MKRTRRQSRSALKPLALHLTLGAALLGCANLPAQNAIAPPQHELHIARLMFRPNLSNTWDPGRPWWAIDWPDAEMHFTDGVSRYTTIDIAPDSRHIGLDSDAIFDFPWLFAQQVGRWHLSDDETGRLRQYLLRGGFLVADDFHGPQQWQVFAQAIDRALYEYDIVDIPAGDELLHVLYELEQRSQIPGRRHLYHDGAGIGVQMPHSPPRWRGIYDANQRLMVAINFNMDMGDAWEHADDPVYPLPMTSLAYRFGINYLLYAMTH